MLKMKVVLFVVALISIGQSSSIDHEWEAFKLKFNKVYNSLTEELYRKSIFNQRRTRIDIHNERFEQGLVTFKLGINQFSDRLFSEVFSNKRSEINDNNNNNLIFTVSENATVPDSVDWRQKGAVTGVKNQGLCGSCWAFSAIGTVESANFLKNGKLVALSEQQLVDCDDSDNGCLGGLEDQAIDYIIANGGVDTEKSYPYRGRSGQCKASKGVIGARVQARVTVEPGNEVALTKAIADIGPISIGIEATDNFQAYAGGILDDPLCGHSKRGINHGVLAVGYGTEKNIDYYIVKNSWGYSFGENGYIRMRRNDNSQCGITYEAYYPIME